ncbi:MAG: type I restriction enzyme HsdR N-terminal domain-containing protein [Microcystis sp. M114S2]|uniref:type I restriction endonuclease n=1 Tax=unclassified Microcystis TaxID=2643300 RepID=UPI002587CB0B|nr:MULTISPECIES: type I restriction endonuclease [unclassified Microcystis]MCA2668573.1 type I restriction enzyme HsdR N-terminal domain-containing protein [Microcystis sp. M045S2]MCA2715730.1 type I restriction enzyme HsdR N-terminal domain-containing protein [Microcystis sp. M172S2]MCA2802938.1 type I restriction enzyme HsdR N-terminal domain-containing protein [Microcystis sp. M114S2]MCA2833099.1 type I restriction enzyme HsdR N-terminal domain-containing protein [Microcystis sp. M007S1]MCA
MEIDKLKAIAQKVETSRSQIQNEQATKTAFIMPFLQAWGYDVFNTMEVHPEYSADLTGLKGEKVDYAICLDNQPIILMECKSCHQNLEHPKHSSQLHRYFNATGANFGVLTNGIIYRFYTDIVKDNIMDDKPFFEFNILDFDDSSVNELKRFSKSSFNSDELEEVARNLLHTKEVKKVIAQQLNDPSPEFVKFFVSHVYSGVRTASVVEKFKEIIKRSLKEYINDIIKEKFEEVLGKEPETNPPDTSAAEDTPPEETGEDKINTTPEELEGFYIIKSILREEINTARIQFKDTRSYFGINLDGKVTKTVCRLRFHEKTGKKSISIPDNVETGKEATTNIDSLDEIYGVAEFLKSRIRYLTQDTYKSKSEKTESI